MATQSGMQNSGDAFIDQPASSAPGGGDTGRMDSTGFAGQNSSGPTGTNPAGLQQQGVGQRPPDLNQEQGSSNSGTSSSNKGVMGKVKSVFSTHDDEGNPKPAKI